MLTFIYNADGENEEALLETPLNETIAETVARLFGEPLFSLPPDVTQHDMTVELQSATSDSTLPLQSDKSWADQSVSPNARVHLSIRSIGGSSGGKGEPVPPATEASVRKATWDPLDVALAQAEQVVQYQWDAKANEWSQTLILAVLPPDSVTGRRFLRNLADPDHEYEMLSTGDDDPRKDEDAFGAVTAAALAEVHARKLADRRVAGLDVSIGTVHGCVVPGRKRSDANRRFLLVQCPDTADEAVDPRAAEVIEAFRHFVYATSQRSQVVGSMRAVPGRPGVYDSVEMFVRDKRSKQFPDEAAAAKALASHTCNSFCAVLALPDDMSIDARGAGIGPSRVTDGRFASTVDNSKTHDLGDLGDFGCVKELKDHKDMVTSLAVSKTHLFSSAADKTINVYELTHLDKVATIKAHRDEVTCLFVDDDRHRLFSASMDNTVKVWDIENPASIDKEVRKIGDVEASHAVAASSAYVVVAWGKQVKVYDRDKVSDMARKELSGHKKKIRCLAVAGHFAFSGSNDKTVRVWDLQDFTCKYVLDEHTGWIRALTIVDKALYSAAYDSSIKVWSLESLECEKTITGGGKVESLCVWNDYLFAGADDARVKVFAVDDHSLALQFKEQKLAVLAIACSDSLIAFGSHDRTVRVYGLL